jgi:hypothetical protein
MQALLKQGGCGAKTRSGSPCKAPVVRSKKRCRMHGGTNGSGARFGNKNALKHGFNTIESKYLQKHIRNLLGDCKHLLAKLF